AASMMVISEAPNETVISSIANKNDQAKTDIEPEVTATKEEQKPEKVEKAVIDPDIRIVGLGDSLTKGSGDSTDQGYIGRLAANLERDTDTSILVENYAVHGRQTPKLYKMLIENNAK
ncbi:hypothetical protein R0J91_13225, partial [Micrococcus sp. SIMBA_131]